MEEAGGRNRLGVDGSASNDGSILCQDCVRRSCCSGRVTALAASATGRFAGRQRIGGLRRPLNSRSPLQTADLALFKLDELRFSGHGDPLAALVLCGAHRADRVMVGGNWVVSDGAVPGLDMPDLIRRHSAAARTMQAG